MRAYRFFDGVAAETRDVLARRGLSRGFTANDVLFRHGDAAGEVFAIDQGRVKMWRSAEAGAQMTVGYARDGELVGIVGATLALPHSVSATAQNRVETTVWSGALIRELAARDVGLSGAISLMLAARTELMVTRLEEIFPSSIGQRIARTLVSFSSIVGHVGHDGTIELPLSRGDLAELAHTTVPTVSRLMSRWRAAGIVDGRRGHIVLRDLATLRGLGGADG